MAIRLTATLGALALGLAAFAAVPVMAQGTAAPPPAQAPAASSGSTGNPMSEGMIRPMHHPKTTPHSAQPMEHHASAHARRDHVTRASEGDAAVARLNAESLTAAQKGRAFMPGGGGMSGGGMQGGGGSGATAGGSR